MEDAKAPSMPQLGGANATGLPATIGGPFHKSIRPFPKGQREMAALGCVTVP